MFVFLDLAMRGVKMVADVVDKLVDKMLNPIQLTDETFQITAEDLPCPMDYSRRSPHTWTWIEICQRVWLQACLTADTAEHLVHIKTISMFQNDVADGPDDPKWKVFMQRMPGFVEYFQQHYTAEDETFTVDDDIIF